MYTVSAQVEPGAAIYNYELRTFKEHVDPKNIMAYKKTIDDIGNKYECKVPIVAQISQPAVKDFDGPFKEFSFFYPMIGCLDVMIPIVFYFLVRRRQSQIFQLAEYARWLIFCFLCMQITACILALEFKVPAQLGNLLVQPLILWLLIHKIVKRRSLGWWRAFHILNKSSMIYSSVALGAFGLGFLAMQLTSLPIQGDTSTFPLMVLWVGGILSRSIFYVFILNRARALLVHKHELVL